MYILYYERSTYIYVGIVCATVRTNTVVYFIHSGLKIEGRMQ